MHVPPQEMLGEEPNRTGQGSSEKQRRGHNNSTGTRSSVTIVTGPASFRTLGFPPLFTVKIRRVRLDPRQFRRADRLVCFAGRERHWTPGS
jgi:hypothetical protein